MVVWTLNSTHALADQSVLLLSAGSLSLETVPLKNALKSEAASWKARFAQNLHGQCAEDLKAFDTYIRSAVQHESGCRMRGSSYAGLTTQQ